MVKDTTSAPVDNDTLDELREKLAAIEHERWADWQKWMHSKGEAYMTGSDKIGLLFRQGYIDHLEKQIATPYSDLSEAEKQSDRDQVDRYWPLIENHILSKQIEELEALLLLTGHSALTRRNIHDRLDALKKRMEK